MTMMRSMYSALYSVKDQEFISKIIWDGISETLFLDNTAKYVSRYDTLNLDD